MLSIFFIIEKILFEFLSYRMNSNHKGGQARLRFPPNLVKKAIFYLRDFRYLRRSFSFAPSLDSRDKLGVGTPIVAHY